MQPSLTEQVIDQWPGWALGPSTPTVNWSDPDLLNNINVVAQVPAAGPVPVNPGDPVYSIFPMQNLVRLADQSSDRDLLWRRIDRKERRH